MYKRIFHTCVNSIMQSVYFADTSHMTNVPYIHIATLRTIYVGLAHAGLPQLMLLKFNDGRYELCIAGPNEVSPSAMYTNSTSCGKL